MNLLKLHEASAVQRWHTWPTIKTQDLAAHSWGVAMICLKLEPQDLELVRAALTHDLHEYEAGDIPYPFKRNNAAVKEAYDRQEEEFAEAHGIPTFLSEKQKAILKWADMFELLLFARREAEMGNSKMWETVKVAQSALLGMGHPNQMARELFMEVGNVRQ